MRPVGSYVTVLHKGVMWTAKVLGIQDGHYWVEGSLDWIPAHEVSWIERTEAS